MTEKKPNVTEKEPNVTGKKPNVTEKGKWHIWCNSKKQKW